MTQINYPNASAYLGDRSRKIRRVIFFLLRVRVIRVKIGSKMGQIVSPLETEGREKELFKDKNKEKVPKSEDFGTFLVEISGIEPLTS